MFKPMTAMAGLAMGVLIAGCGKQTPVASEPAAEAPPPAEEASSGADPREVDYLKACELKMTAPEVKEWTTYWDPRGKLLVGEGPSAVHSTYWVRDEDHQKLVDATLPAMELNCSFKNADGAYEISLNIASRGGIGEADVPYGPGTYPIVPRSKDSNAPKGFWVYPLMYGESIFEATGGTLTITRFDTNGIAGSFHVEGAEHMTGTRAISIDGTFDVPCRGGATEEKCTAGKAIVD
jgi:hypothetical protein